MADETPNDEGIYDAVQDEYTVGDENIRDKTKRELRWFFLQGCETWPGPRIGPAPDRRYTPEQLAQQELNAKQRRIMRAVFWAIILLALILFLWLMLATASDWPAYHDEWSELDPM